MLNWDTTKEETQAISKIVKRASKEVEIDFLSSTMDITAVHCNGNPLDLEKFLKADAFNFMHDFMGIMNCIDRNTGKLRNCFLPRCSRPENQ